MKIWNICDNILQRYVYQIYFFFYPLLPTWMSDAFMQFQSLMGKQ